MTETLINRRLMDLHGLVHLEVASFSSEEPHARAKSLNSAESGPTLHRLLGDPLAVGESSISTGWQSEKFCEYPQQLVFRVCRNNLHPMAIIESLVLVSHPTLIASRMEIFLSKTTTTEWQRATFQRLGYIAFQKPQESQASATQELKTVPLAGGIATYIKLHIHSCHVHCANLFNQVGLACIVALGSGSNTHGETNDGSSGSTISLSAALKKRVQQSKMEALEDVHASISGDFSSSNLPYSASFPQLPAVTVKSGLRKPFPSAPALSTPGTHAIWIEDRGEYTTPIQILTRIQLAREHHALLMQSRLETESHLALFHDEQRLWLVDELECKQLMQKMARLEHEEASARTVEERLATRHNLDATIMAMQQLEARVSTREVAMQRDASRSLKAQLANSPIKNARSRNRNLGGLSSSAFPLKDKWATWDQWQLREEFLWKAVEAIKRFKSENYKNGDGTEPTAVPGLLDEALEIAIQGLSDPHAQVFVAANELLKYVLPLHPRFQHGCAWSQEVTTTLKLLTQRLNDLQPVIRNNAAFAIVQIAQHTRAQGSFVMHHLLQYAESHRFQLCDLTLHSVLKILSALLGAFHCCARIDIAPKRVLTFVWRSDALLHGSGYVREAARQLLMVLHGEIGGDLILAFFRHKKLPVETVKSMEELFAVLVAKQQPQQTTSESAGSAQSEELLERAPASTVLGA